MSIRLLLSLGTTVVILMMAGLVYLGDNTNRRHASFITTVQQYHIPMLHQLDRQIALFNRIDHNVNLFQKQDHTTLSLVMVGLQRLKEKTVQLDDSGELIKQADHLEYYLKKVLTYLPSSVQFSPAQIQFNQALQAYRQQLRVLFQQHRQTDSAWLEQAMLVSQMVHHVENVYLKHIDSYYVTLNTLLKDLTQLQRQMEYVQALLKFELEDHHVDEMAYDPMIKLMGELDQSIIAWQTSLRFYAEEAAIMDPSASQVVSAIEVANQYKDQVQAQILSLNELAKVHIRLEQKEMAQKTVEIRYWLIFLGSLTFFITLITAWIMNRSVSVPVKVLTQGALQFSQQQWSHRLPQFRWQEFNQLSSAYNHMAEELQADIVRREASEHRLTQVLHQNESILKGVGDGVYGVDQEGRLTFINPMAEQLIGWTEADLLGQDPHLLLHHSCVNGLPLEQEEAPVYQTLQDGQTRWADDQLCWRADGESFPTRLICTAIIEDLQITGAVVTFQDITQRKQYEHALRQAKEMAEHANQSKSDFLANMSHEIRTPLNAILGMSELLMESSLTEEQTQHLNVLTHTSDSLLALINDILDMSKIEADQLTLENTAFDLPDLLKGVIGIFRHRSQSKGLKLVSQWDESLPTYVKGDAQRLRQVLLNLMSNAVKFTHNGQIALIAIPQGQAGIHFRVEDSGVGIATEQLERIFQPFQQADLSITRRFGGTGLGLSISRRLVEAMGGSLKAESQELFGSQFFFSLPLKVVQQMDAADVKKVVRGEARAQRPEQRQVESKKILLVDDSEDNRMLITAFLKKTEHVLTLAENGVEAVDLCLNEPFDLVFMDIQMPVMDGITATKEIRLWEQRNKKASLPIIALTAHALKEYEDQSHEAGCDLYLTKPIKKKRLLDIIQNYG
ncbi:ATP-binding protein [Magnetococcus sp. PR-3]|uniref:ATP-binding protein n=1 Tax=Magnetococcus sp. PR-3 TaxID=3120355 RepID=UPI002FCDE380